MPTEANGVVGDNVRQVTTAGTRVQLSTTSTPCRSVCITALDTNTGTIVVGSVTCVAAAGTHATPTRRGTPLGISESVTYRVSDLNLLYLDATVSADGVSYSYETA